MSRRPARTIAAAVAAGLVLALGGFAVGRLTAGSVVPPTTESAAAGFLRDMQVHHAQAVEMSLLVRDRTDDEVVRTIAYDIATSQAAAGGAMYGLLDAWDLPQAAPGRSMEWALLPALDGSAGHDHDMEPGAGPADMPGMASRAELDALRDASGDDAVRLFLELMIEHHEGGLDMAEAVLARTTVPQVVTLATGIEQAQRAEIATMSRLLTELPAA